MRNEGDQVGLELGFGDGVGAACLRLIAHSHHLLCGIGSAQQRQPLVRNRLSRQVVVFPTKPGADAFPADARSFTVHLVLHSLMVRHGS